MSKNSAFNIKDRIKGFSFALNGIRILFNTQHNSWIHALSAMLVIAAGYYFNINKAEWCFIIIAIGLVLITETLNTSIEYLVDLVSPEYNLMAGKIKDLAAGAVLFAALLAVIIGLIIFLPKLLI